MTGDIELHGDSGRAAEDTTNNGISQCRGLDDVIIGSGTPALEPVMFQIISRFRILMVLAICSHLCVAPSLGQPRNASAGGAKVGHSSTPRGAAHSSPKSGQIKSADTSGTGVQRGNSAATKGWAAGQGGDLGRRQAGQTDANTGARSNGATATPKPAKAATGRDGIVTAATSKSLRAVAPANANAAGWKGRTFRRHRSHSDAYSYAPTGTPALSVDSSRGFEHVLSFGSRRRGDGTLPRGVTGIEVWGKIGGPAPTDPSELKQGAVANGMTYTLTFDASQRGQTAYYAVRHVNSQGAGPWSKIVRAPIVR